MRLRKNIFYILAFFCCYAVNAQSTASDFAREIKQKNLKKHVYVLASDSCAGRGVNTHGIDIARNYIQKQWDACGLKGLYHQDFLQEFQLLQLQSKEVVFASKNSTFTVMDDYRYSGNHDDFNQELPVYFAGYSDFENLDSVSIQGKAVFILKNNLRTAFLEARKAHQKGAALSIIANPKIPKQFGNMSRQFEGLFYSPKYQLINGKSYSYFDYETDSRYCEVSSDVVKEITNHSLSYWHKASKKKEKIGSEIGSVKIWAKPIQEDTVAAYNVISKIPGIKKDEYILIGAHYDHLGVIKDEIYYGADDNASGVSALIEIAKQFAKAYEQGYRPQRGIIFAAFSAEEGGVYGSEYFVEQFENSSEIKLMLNIDMIGRSDAKHIDDEDYFYFIKHNLSDSIVSQSEQICKRYGIEPDYSSSVNGSDHRPFAEKGIATIFYFDGKHKDLHLPTDVASKINYGKMTRITRIIFETAWKNAQVVGPE